MAFTGRRGDSQYSPRAPLPLNPSMWAWNTNTHVQVVCAGEGGSWATRNDSFHTCGQWWLGHSPSSTVMEPRPPSRADTISEFLLAASFLQSHRPTFFSLSHSLPRSQYLSRLHSARKRACGGPAGTRLCVGSGRPSVHMRTPAVWPSAPDWGTGFRGTRPLGYVHPEDTPSHQHCPLQVWSCTQAFC